MTTELNDNSDPPSSSGPGWFRAMRHPDGMELMKANPKAFCLLYVIAFRARYSVGFNRHNLALGEACIGDHENYGMSEREYRTAKQQLAKWGFATFRTTSKGTVANLANIRVFSIFRPPNDEQNDRQATGRRRASDGQPTTIKNDKKEIRNKNERGVGVFLETKVIDPTK